MQRKLFTYFMLLLSMALVSCKEKYLPVLNDPPTGYLVVEGFISSGQQPSTITLTRSTKLYDPGNIVYEKNAAVNIESENHETFLLNEISDGVYESAPALSLDNSQKYHLLIKTQDGKEFASDFVPVKHSPPIDSISWQRENEGLRIYVNTHDPQNSTKYYQWKYEETWEFHAAYLTTLEYERDPVSFDILGVQPKVNSPDTSIYKCWQSHLSTNIIIGSSEKLSSDVIFLPLLFIEPASEKLSVLYSINVRQYALSHEAYLFYEKIKKNTEQLGSIFDAQPSDLQGNIHCTSIPGEVVVGYVEVSEEKDQRIFISNADVPGWNYQQFCRTISVENQVDSIKKYATNLEPTTVNDGFGVFIKTFFASSQLCIDCTLRGTNVRPPFWP